MTLFHEIQFGGTKNFKAKFQRKWVLSNVVGILGENCFVSIIPDDSDVSSFPEKQRGGVCVVSKGICPESPEFKPAHAVWL